MLREHAILLHHLFLQRILLDKKYRFVYLPFTLVAGPVIIYKKDSSRSE